MTNKVWLKYVMALVPSRWSFEGLLGAERRPLSGAWTIDACVDGGSGIVDGRLDCAVEELRNATPGGGGLGFTTYHQPFVALGVLAGFTVIALIAVMILLKRRDSV